MVLCKHQRMCRQRGSAAVLSCGLVPVVQRECYSEAVFVSCVPRVVAAHKPDTHGSLWALVCAGTAQDASQALTHSSFGKQAAWLVGN